MGEASPDRVARKYIKRANPVQTMGTIGNHLAGLQAYAQMLGTHWTSLMAVWNSGDRRRQQRASKVRLSNVRRDQNDRVVGRAHGTADYAPWIVMQLRPQYGCTCPDFTKNSAKVGPCKHILSLSGFWVNKHVVPTLNDLESKLMGTLEKAEYD